MPLGEGEPASEWDGSSEEAEVIVDSMADIAGSAQRAERERHASLLLSGTGG